MFFPDVNVLIYAFRVDSERHRECREWLEELVNSDSSFAISTIVLSSLVRITTHKKIFKQPSKLSEALKFSNLILGSKNCIELVPGVRHWDIFNKLCEEVNAKGNLITDAYLAALAIEHDCKWISFDNDFAKFTGLKWEFPA